MAITRTGHVVENPADGQYEIGLRFFDGTGGDGSVVVDGGSSYPMTTDIPGYLNLFVGGYGANGLLQVTGAGSAATMTGQADNGATTRATIGGDAGAAVGGQGSLVVESGGAFRMLGVPTPGGGGPGEGVLEIGAIFGRGVARIDSGGLVSIGGFTDTILRVGSYGGDGALHMPAGGRIEMTGNSFLLVGGDPLGRTADGRGNVLVGGGSTIDLGGNGRVQIGGTGMSGFPDPHEGRLTVTGAGSGVTGFTAAVVGIDPAVTPTPPGTRGVLTLADGAVFGGAGSTTTIGQTGTLHLEAGRIGGSLVLGQGAITMESAAFDAASVAQRLRILAGAGFMTMTAASGGGNDTLAVEGDVAVEDGAQFRFELFGGATRFVAGDRFDLIRSEGGFTFAAGSQTTAKVHAAFNPDFGYVFGTDAATGQVFGFEALTNMDGAGQRPVLALAGGTTGAQAVFDAATGQTLIEGGRFGRAFATGLDHLDGTARADTFDFRAAPDPISIDAGAGNDRIEGSALADTLRGGDGTDTIIGGAGDDILFGGSTAADLRDVIYGGDGNDSIDGGHGNDELHGGEGRDTILGDFGSDTLIGNAGDDVLIGGALSDLLLGGPGNDFMNGGFGFDRMNGGTGADRFFHLGIADHGSDWVQDYRAAEGDRLVHGLGAGAVRPDQFQVNLANTPGAGAADVAEAFVIFRPTGQILWALVDGAAETAIIVQAGSQVFDLLA